MDVPQELSTLRQWIVWRDEDGRKIPYQVNGSKAKSNDASTWSSLDECWKVVGNYSGLGFVFAEGGELWGMDLDGCRNQETGELAEWAECIVNEIGTYAEVSPSGTGVKLWGRGSVGNGRRIAVDEEHVCAKSPAIEVYDHGRYFTFTGQRLGGLELSAFDPLNIVRAFESQVLPSSQPEIQINSSRPQLYIASVPGCSEGNRNQTAFRLAACLLNDFAMGELEAWPLLCSWNDRNSPPLAESELRGCFKSAGRNAKRARGEKLSQQSDQPASDLVDLSGITNQPKHHARLAKAQPKAQQPIDPGPFPSDCLDVPGLVGDVMEHNLRTAMYPQPELALAGAISLLAVITGRKICDERGTRTNLYALGLSPSGSGKEHARTINKNILIDAGIDGERMVGPERIGSSAGLVAAVAAQPAVLFHIDEFGKMLATMRSAAKSPHLFNIAAVLMQLYSSSNTIWVADAYADLKKTKRIIQPHACVYGTGTPDDFWSGLTKENISDGLLGRLLVFENGYVRRQKPKQEPVPPGVLERVRQWLEFRASTGGNLGDAAAPKQMVVPLSQEASKRLDEHLDTICERREKEQPSTAAVWSRSGEKTAKLALLFACSRWDGNSAVKPLIELEDINRAVKVVNWLTRKMIYKAFEHVSENDNEAKSKKLLRSIVGEMTLTEINRKTQWLRPRERRELLEDLCQCGYVAFEQRETAGRPVTFYKRAT